MHFGQNSFIKSTPGPPDHQAHAIAQKGAPGILGAAGPQYLQGEFGFLITNFYFVK
jgi:hypothetical protein